MIRGPMSKRAVLSLLKRLAFAHELVGDARRARVYSSAMWPLRSVQGDLAELQEAGELRKLRGIGRGVEALIEQALAGEEPAELAELEASIPPGLFEVARVRGLGPKTVRRLWTELGVESLSELHYACTENRLARLDGFGAKKQASVLASVEELRRTAGLFTRDRVREALEALEPLLAGGRFAAVGAWRRGEEVLDGLDLLVQQHVELPERYEGVPVRVTVASGSWGLALVRATGPEEHLDLLEGVGLPQLVGELPDEDAVYAALGFACPPAELRHRPTALVASGPPRPRLVRLEDLQGALHNHSTWSDGANDLREMKAGAEALGWRWLGISEHSASAAYAMGLVLHRLHAQRAEIVQLNAEGGCRILAGVESDIRREGELDYPLEELQRLDFVVASVHERFGQGPEAMTERVLRAVRDPGSSLIGHPTGRMLLGRAPTGLDVEAMLRLCAATGTAVELNASPHRLDLAEAWLELARELGVLVSIAADAHSVGALRNLEFGVSLARRAGLGPDEVLNTRSADEVLAWERARRASAAG
jgi:DNA polymerase (family 10)